MKILPGGVSSRTPRDLCTTFVSVRLPRVLFQLLPFE
jgi:hypothetical protein